ncbi:MAG: hypothetical protein HYX93_05745 [Chloroflexi bacterium]|nr:hypothetical protein [Chloroflexota bacterium]
MATSDAGEQQEWKMLAEASEQEREAKILERYRELAALPEEALRSQMEALVPQEYELPDNKLRAFTISRLRSWLALEPEEAKKIATVYDSIMRQKMPGPQAMRRVSTVQTVARDFSREDQNRLMELVPGVFAGARLGVTPPVYRPEPTPTAPAKQSRGWWPFKRR